MESRRVRNRRGLWGLLGIGVLVGLLAPVSAECLTLLWDPNTEADLAGYKVHIGISPGTYTQAINVGRVTTFTVPDLPPGATYYFAVTAYDIFANDSGFSNQVSTSIPVVPPPGETTPPPSGGTTTPPTTITPPPPTATTPPPSGGGGTAGTTTPPADSSPSLTAAQLLRQQGQQLYQQGQYRDAIRAYNQALRRYQELRDLEHRALVLEELGRAFEALGDSRTAARKYEQARRIRQRLANG